MAEIRTVTTLRRKRTEILASIAGYEKQLAQARADLSHITAAISIFEASGDPKGFPAYVDVHRLFKYREPVTLCMQALAQNGPQTTKQLALHLMKAKGLDTGDKVLAKALALKLVHAMRMQAQRGRVIARGKVKGTRIWELPPQKTLV